MGVPHLILGNARYSSWSLRAFAVLRRAGIEFTTEFLPLRTDEFRSRMAEVSPFALVPTLLVGDEVIGDTMAISEWAAEQVPSLWPRDEFRRAQARMMAAQMHASFMNIRRELPMDLYRQNEPRVTLKDEVVSEVSKLSAAWGQALHKSGGPFLFGEWSIADAFYLPIASRFSSYAISLPAELQDYCDALLATPEFAEWKAIADEEDWIIEDYLVEP